MSEYSLDINTSLYKYRQPIYITEPAGERQTYIPLKLNLNSGNFNFDLARSDGLDFRLAERSNGTGVFQMWLAYWNGTTRKATLWFKLPELLANETRTLFAYWGYEYDSGISNLDNLTNGITKEYSTNLCVSGTVTGAEVGGGSPDDVFDGNLYTYWWGLPRGTWIQYDFGAGNEKQIELVRIFQHDIQNFVIQGSNNGTVFVDLLNGQIADMPAGVFPDIMDWSTVGFSNIISYRYIRINIISVWNNYATLGEIEMMDTVSLTEKNDGVFTFADDFDGTDLDVSKWPTSQGTWDIGDSTINLGTDAWIRTANVLGGRSTVYTDYEWLLTPTAGLWGQHNTSGNCYLSTHYLSTGANELIDGTVDVENTNPLIYVAGTGCSLGVDLGSITKKISRVRIYLYNVPEDTSSNSFIDGAWAKLLKSDTNDSDSYELIHTYIYEEMILVQVAPYVWYYDLHFEAPGQSSRYIMFQAYHLFDNYMQYDVTEIRVYARDSSVSTAPGNFLVEEGMVGVGSSSSTTVAAHRYRFYDGDNTFGIDYYWEGGVDRRHNALYVDTFSTYNGTGKGLEKGSYSQNYLAYYEPTDHIYQGMANRDTYADYDDSWERKVHRNTEVSNFRVYGEDTWEGNGVAIDWIVVRDFTPDSDPVVDLTDLWLDYEYVGHQTLDYIEYTSDVTSVDFYHSSDMGGDPYRMSDDVTNSISNVFISDGTTTLGSLVIDFGRGRHTITDDDYKHFNSNNTVVYYNASKLSNLDTDIHSRDYWQTTASSGWAAIEFPGTEDIACLSLKAVLGNADGMPDNFRFHGSQSNPRFGEWEDKVLLYEGQARAVEEEQAFYFYTGLTSYKYYILEVLGTHGNNVAIREWGMYERSNIIDKKVISQLRLHPVAFEDNEYHFVKEIEFYGSNDGFNWDLLVSRIDTPTPFTDYTYGRWSRYSFGNLDDYYLYKLTCYDNWRAAEDTIKIAEWEMLERVDETYNFRILSGGTNNINNIWADPNTTISSGTMYVTNDRFNTVEYDKLIQSAPLYITIGYWGEVLVDNVTVSGTVTASVGPFGGNSIYDAPWAFDGNITGAAYWHTAEYAAYPVWVQYRFTEPLSGASMSVSDVTTGAAEYLVNGKLHGPNFWEDDTSPFPAWCKYDSSTTPQVINGYSLSAGGAETARMPKTWQFQGSNNDLDWDTLDSRAGEADWAITETRYYSFTNITTEYKYYRLYITEGNNVSILRMFEWFLFKADLPTPPRVVALRMWPRPDQTIRMPGDFVLKGSNTGVFGGEEIDIFSATAETYPADQWTEFNFTNPSSYLYYRIHITSEAPFGTGGDDHDYMNIYEIEMGGYIPEYMEEYETGLVADFNIRL